MSIPSSRLMADISNNQGRFDSRTYRSRKHRVIGIKATEGVGGRQNVYTERVHKAHDAGLHVIHYHFARLDNHVHADEEAAEFMEVVNPRWKRGDRVCLDLEDPPGGRSIITSPRAYLIEFAEELHRHAGRVGVDHAWLYTGTWFYREHALHLPKGWRLWLADYSFPILGRRWGVPTPWVHQFTDGVHGPLPHEFGGIGQCDGSALSRRAAIGLHLG